MAAALIACLYVQAHFTSDVIAGLLMALAWVLLACRALRPYAR